MYVPYFSVEVRRCNYVKLYFVAKSYLNRKSLRFSPSYKSEEITHRSRF